MQLVAEILSGICDWRVAGAVWIAGNEMRAIQPCSDDNVIPRGYLWSHSIVIIAIGFSETRRIFAPG